jgi:hypothetical protein
MRMILLSAALLASAGCKPKADDYKPVAVERVAKGSKTDLPFDAYVAAMEGGLSAGGETKVNRIGDVNNGVVITTSKPDGCAIFRRHIQPGGDTEMPDDSYIVCREGDLIRWKLDRR